MDLEDDGRRVRHPTMGRFLSHLQTRLVRLCYLPEFLSQSMTGERCALVFCAIATLFSFIALIAVRNNTLTVDLKVSELSKMVSELEASNQLLANDLALLISIPPGTTTIEVLCQQMESSQTNISALYQQVGQLQAGMADLDDRVASLDGGAGAGGGSIFPAGWLNDFMSVEVDENNDASLVITAPAISFRTPQAKTITQQIQGQNNWHWSSDTIDCHVGDTITWDWSTNENIIEADSTFNPLSNPSFSSGALNLGGSYSHVFKASGTHYYMSQNTASLSGTVVVYPGNVQAHSGLLQVPTSGSGAAFRPACAFDTVGTLYMERNMISVCMEFSVHDFAQPGFGQLRYAFAPMAGFETTSIYGGYEYATMDGCPENPDTDSPCQTATQYGSENAIALPSGWSIATWSSSSSSYAYQYFHGNWGAYSLVAKYSSSTYMWSISCSSTGSCSSSYSNYYNCDYSSSSTCIRISYSGGKYYITTGSSQSHSSTSNWKILIRRQVG
uniref:Uncharacterized protein n=1 Tax=Octactis speculum TaxID=3111310 RepID=A0A7S2F0L6_9STRA|mmetsp:Transcript_1016/g.1257  ORF Transcript_1016/g.1257 Transcript_1016/m.1257 type:complete len:501 (+) Transcript_1016:39-1541(+)